MMIIQHHTASVLSIVLALLAVITLVCAQDNDADLTVTKGSGIEDLHPSSDSVQPTIFDLLEINGASTVAKLLKTSSELKDVRDLLALPSSTLTFFAPNDHAMETLPEMEYQTTFKYLTLLKPMTLVEMSNESTNILNTSLTGSKEPLRGRNGSTMGFVLAIAKQGQDHVLWSSSPQSPGRFVHGDIKASNGILHIIDKAITAPMSAEWVLQNTPDLSEFYKVSRNLNLTSESLYGKTLFAVSNSAMLQFPSETWSSPQQVLAIQSHMIAGTYYSNNLTTSKIIDPNTKASLSIAKLTDNDININDAKVLVKDILTANGKVSDTRVFTLFTID
ncbi:hypothetical protein INT44_003463 [Umbelopsis vinacea]|uniref:FAS1 domain-containing protein n=1 Tax=Umbelopsis vinacea TaxID=44442 RepID=A0A8H7UIN0_9FUNG|nr:hypothetical protein INT44_003463 [Umbelopsis vinacea]